MFFLNAYTPICLLNFFISFSPSGIGDLEKNIALYKLSKSAIKTLLTTANNGISDTSFTIRRQFVGTTNSSGAVSFTAGANETFLAFDEERYALIRSNGNTEELTSDRFEFTNGGKELQ